VKIALIVVAVVVGVGLLLELGLRWIFGFGNPLIYEADQQMGYLLAPHQITRRFGNRIAINGYSMRSPDITASRPSSTLRILLLGDSIANGGWWTDQDDIISELLRQQLQPVATQQGFEQVEVLNASANSWGPRNELAYLQRFGTFDAQVVVVLLNTDDLFATTPTSLQVGRDRNYPNRKPPFALVEVFSRYLWKPSLIPGLAAVQAEGGDRVGANLNAIRQIKAIAQHHQGTLLLAITPLLREIGKPGSRDYEIKARQRLTELLQTEQIAAIDFLSRFNAEPQPQLLYRDHIHLTDKGNQIISQTLTELITPHINSLVGL
jgi:hypothetical protein